VFMQLNLTNAIRFFVRLLVGLRPQLPASIELDMKHLQGKGTGSESFESEIRSAFSFLDLNAHPNPIVFDVGANQGLYSQTLLQIYPDAKIIAFEPSTKSREQLERRFIKDNRVTVVPFALGRDSAPRNLYSDRPGSGLSSLTKRRLEHFNIEFDYSEEVNVITLDAWTETNKLSPDFIKLDVEGHEYEVLSGGMKVLDSVKVVQFEFGGCNIDTRTYFQDFWYFFYKNGFSLYRVTPKGPLRVMKYSEEDEYFSTTNYLAVRELLRDNRL
jgi:FkbM family methyltransferase